MLNQLFNIHLQEELKNQIDMLFGQFDLTASDALRIFQRSVIVYDGMPFTTNLKPKDVPTGDTVIFGRTDDNVFKECKKILKRDGYTFSVAARIYLSECVKQKCIPFVVKL